MGLQLNSPLAHPQLVANAVIFLCGNLTGAFHKHQMQDASRELFTYTVKCIQIRRKLRIEKRQQVWALPPPGAWSCPALPGPTPRVLSLCTSDLCGTASPGVWGGPPGLTLPLGMWEAGSGAGRRPAEMEGAVGRMGGTRGQMEATGSLSLWPDVPLPVRMGPRRTCCCRCCRPTSPWA